jgi:hypothetical protein
MFKIIHLDGTQKIPDDDICYILAKSGMYLKKKVGLIESLTPVKNISILEDIQPYAKMNIPRIPGEDFGKIMSFFKKVYEEYRSEAIVLLYYNSKKESYKIYVPHQKVNGASVDYVKSVSIKNHIQVGTIHSHANFSAFHSGTDDNDEKHFDGIHITVGDNLDDFPSISASIVVNGMRFPGNPIDYITKMEIVEYTKYFPQMFKPSFIEINGEKEYTKMVKSKLGYKLTTSDKEKEFDPEWFTKVEGHAPITIISSTYLELFDKQRGITDGVSGFEPHLWNIPEKSNNTPKYDPCGTCAFKKYKSKEEDGKITINEIKNEEVEEKDNQEGYSTRFWDSGAESFDWWQ